MAAEGSRGGRGRNARKGIEQADDLRDSCRPAVYLNRMNEKKRVAKVEEDYAFELGESRDKREVG